MIGVYSTQLDSNTATRTLHRLQELGAEYISLTNKALGVFQPG